MAGLQAEMSTTVALARGNATFMARWLALEKPRSFYRKVPNQYPSKLRKLPANQLHYILLDGQEYWMEILAEHFPPSWVDTAAVLYHLSTIIPLSAPCGTKPYVTLKSLLKRAIDSGTRAGWHDDADIQCPLIPLSLLYAVKANGSAKLGAGDSPAKVIEDLSAARLSWLTEEPDKSTIPKCWRTWAIRNDYPHAKSLTKSESSSNGTTQRQHNRFQAKGIPRRFSESHRSELAYDRPQIMNERHDDDNSNSENNTNNKEIDEGLVRDDESFELWDPSVREEVQQTPATEQRRRPSSTQLSQRTKQAVRLATRPASLGSPSSSNDQAPSTTIDEEANVLNINTLDDLRKLLIDFKSQPLIRCPAPVELLPSADAQVHEAFATYTKHFHTKVKAAMMLTLGQVLLASPLANMLQQSETMPSDLARCREETEGVREQLSDMIAEAKDENQQEAPRLRADISELRAALRKTIRHQEHDRESATTHGSYQITTRAAAARADRVKSVHFAPDAQTSPMSLRSDGGNARKRLATAGNSDQHSNKRQKTSKKPIDVKTVYASYFEDDE